MDDIVDRAEKDRFLVAFQPIDHYPGSSSEKEEIEEISPTSEELQKVVATLLRRKAQGSPILDSRPYIQNMVRYRSLKQYPCLAGRLRFALSPQGKIAPCDYLLPEKEFPRVPDQGLVQALHNLAEMDPIVCTGCYCSGSFGLDPIFRLNPGAALNAFNGLRPRRR